MEQKPARMKKLNPDYIKAAQDVANQCPYFRLQSMSIEALDVGTSILEIAVEEKHLQPYGIIHGGVFASIIDAATFWAAFAELDEDSGMTTVEIKVNYLAPAKSGRLIARGRRIRLGKTIALAEAQVTDPDGKLLATGSATMMIIPGFGFETGSEMPPKYVDD